MFTVNAPTYASLRAFKPNQVRENCIASPSIARVASLGRSKRSNPSMGSLEGLSSVARGIDARVKGVGAIRLDPSAVVSS